MGEPVKKPRHIKWHDELLFDIYELAAEGLGNTQIARLLGISKETFQLWLQKRPLVKYAVTKARKFRDKVAGSKTLDEWFFETLSKEQRELWNRVNAIESHPSGVERLQALFERHGAKARQNLFLYALLHSNFSRSFACRKVGISLNQLDTWIAHDPDFVKCLDMVHECKREFFESRLIKKVVEGDTHAIMYANRTQNRLPGFLHDGYGDKIDVSVNGKIDHNHTHVHKIDVTQLDLPLETRKVILDAVRARRVSEEVVEPKALPAR